MHDFSVLTIKTKTRPWRDIYHGIEITRPKKQDIETSRPKSHNIEILRTKNHDIETGVLKHHDIEKRRQLSHSIVILRHFFSGQKATASGSQDWKTTTSRFQYQKPPHQVSAKFWPLCLLIVTAADYPGTTEPYTTKNNCI